VPSATTVAFSTQAAYAAPLILLAQTRQAGRDKKHADMLEEHRNAQTEHEEAAERRETEYLEQERDLHGRVLKLLAQNTQLTEKVARLATELHAMICRSAEDADGDRPGQDLREPGVGDLSDARA
jgi:uncharacterized membrane protein